MPVPGEPYDGAFINHPDTDLPDPALNTSGVPGHPLYYKENLPAVAAHRALTSTFCTLLRSRP